MDRVPVTKQGFEALKKELQNLKKIERPENIKAIEEARAHGYLSENAEYTSWPISMLLKPTSCLKTGLFSAVKSFLRISKPGRM